MSNRKNKQFSQKFAVSLQNISSRDEGANPAVSPGLAAPSPVVLAPEAAGRRFNRGIIGLSFGLKTETHLLVTAQIFPTAQIFLELKFILGIQDEP